MLIPPFASSRGCSGCSAPLGCSPDFGGSALAAAFVRTDPLANASARRAEARIRVFMAGTPWTAQQRRRSAQSIVRSGVAPRGVDADIHTGAVALQPPRPDPCTRPATGDVFSRVAPLRDATRRLGGGRRAFRGGPAWVTI